jgi:hypothetical protein
MLFTAAGAILKGFAHEPPMTPYERNRRRSGLEQIDYPTVD